MDATLQLLCGHPDTFRVSAVRRGIFGYGTQACNSVISVDKCYAKRTRISILGQRDIWFTTLIWIDCAIPAAYTTTRTPRL